MSAQDILKMIETVDPNDTAKLDEIDARVCAYLRQREYSSHKRGDSLSPDMFGWLTVYVGNHEIISFFSSYTRSRDALKAIRPEGWLVNIEPRFFCEFLDNRTGFYVVAVKPLGLVIQEDFAELETPLLKNEELAELHAIIQAIAYERSK